jgi:hypothetical protein
MYEVKVRRGWPFHFRDRRWRQIPSLRHHLLASEIDRDSWIDFNQICSLGRTYIFNLLASGFRCNEQETNLQNAEAGSNGNGIEIFDSQGFHFFIFMFDGDFIEITLFALKKEEKCALREG